MLIVLIRASISSVISTRDFTFPIIIAKATKKFLKQQSIQTGIKIIQKPVNFVDKFKTMHLAIKHHEATAATSAAVLELKQFKQSKTQSVTFSQQFSSPSLTRDNFCVPR